MARMNDRPAAPGAVMLLPTGNNADASEPARDAGARDLRRSRAKIVNSLKSLKGSEAMSSTPKPESLPDLSTMPFGALAPVVDYAVDAAQRTILYWDVMR